MEHSSVMYQGIGLHLILFYWAGSSHDVRLCDLILPSSSAHLPEVSAQPAAAVPFDALPPPFLAVLAEAPFS